VQSELETALTDDRVSFSASKGALPTLRLDHLPSAALSFDREGRIVAVNALWSAALGHGGEDSVGRALAFFLTEQSRPKCADWLSSDDVSGTLQLDLLHSDGTARPFLVAFTKAQEESAGFALLTDVSALVDEAAQLRSGNDRMAAILEGAECATWEWNLQTGETRFNARWAMISETEPVMSGPVGVQDWPSLYHPFDRNRVRQELDRHLSGQSDLYDVEARIRHEDGTWLWIRDVGKIRSWTADGRPEWMSGVRRDITDRKGHENQLRRSQELLERAGMLTGLGTWEVDLRRGDIFWSDETCRIHGVEPGYRPTLEEALEFYPAEVRPAVQAALEAGMKYGTPWDFEWPMLTRTGEKIWIRAVGEVTFEGGEPVCLNGAIQDISARKENERRLAEAAEAAERARNRLNTLADNAPGALFEHRETPSGAIDLPYFSANLPDLLGVPRAVMEADGAAAAANIHPEDASGLTEAIRVSRDTLSPLDFRYRLTHPEKGLRWMHLSSIPFRQPDGAILWYGNVLDVTERMKAQERLADTLEELRIAHERLHTIAENIPGALFEYRRERDGSVWFPYFTRKFADLLETSAEVLEKNGIAAFRNIPLADQVAIAKELDRSRRSLSVAEFRHRVLLHDGGIRWLNVWAAPFPQKDGAMTWFGKALDVTDSVEIEAKAAAATEKLRHAHIQLNLIADIAPVGLFEFRVSPDGRRQYTYTSARFCDLVGIDESEFATERSSIMDRVDDEDIATMKAKTRESLTELTPWAMRFRYHHPKRGLIWLSASSTPRREADGGIAWTGAMHEITADVEREAEIRKAHRIAERMRAENERLAFHDVLTGLPNRRFFDKMLKERVEAAHRGEGGRDCTLIQIDLDHFKHVNDTLGHVAGDQVLQRVADVLRSTLRETDFAARLGGDEFSVVLAPSSTKETAERIAERLRARLSEPFRYRNCPCRVSASFGIVHAPDITVLEEELQLFADAALYRAKEGGRNRMEVFGSDFTRGIRDNRQLASELQDALEHDQFVPYFQPQISAVSGRLQGVEALARWQHPERGLLLPRDFMNVAEHLRMVPDIDRIMMEKACGALERWRRDGLFIPKISFNVSSGRMHDPDILDAARDMARFESQMALELVESICVEEEGNAFRKHLCELRAAGIGIEIDDFGSGHTSIIGLMEIEPSALKIDRRIVTPVAENKRAADLVRSIVEMARILGIATVAEGVETQEQAEALRAMGCDILQGFLISPALSEADLFAFARRSGPRIVSWG